MGEFDLGVIAAAVLLMILSGCPPTLWERIGSHVVMLSRWLPFTRNWFGFTADDDSTESGMSVIVSLLTLILTQGAVFILAVQKTATDRYLGDDGRVKQVFEQPIGPHDLTAAGVYWLISGATMLITLFMVFAWKSPKAGPEEFQLSWASELVNGISAMVWKAGVRTAEPKVQFIFNRASRIGLVLVVLIAAVFTHALVQADANKALPGQLHTASPTDVKGYTFMNDGTQGLQARFDFEVLQHFQGEDRLLFTAALNEQLFKTHYIASTKLQHRKDLKLTDVGDDARVIASPVQVQAKRDHQFGLIRPGKLKYRATLLIKPRPAEPGKKIDAAAQPSLSEFQKEGAISITREMP